jgi:hypothetical protein
VKKGLAGISKSNFREQVEYLPSYWRRVVVEQAHFLVANSPVGCICDLELRRQRYSSRLDVHMVCADADG